jgi:glycosyltransferase involved in cell wall biosynthesis
LSNTDDKYGRRRIKRRALISPAPSEAQQGETPAVEEKKASPGRPESPEPQVQAIQPPPETVAREVAERERGQKREIRPQAPRLPRGMPRERKPRDRPQPKRASGPKRAEREKVKVSVVVPAYNEAENIFPLMEQFNSTFREAKFSGEVILVDDGSADRTFLKASQCQSRYPFLRVLAHKKNRGLTAALETGFNDARGEIFVFYPADLQYHADDLPALIEKIELGYDIVTGWRQGRYGLKRFVSTIYNFSCRLLFNLKVHDLNSVKAFRREVFSDIPLRRDWHRYIVVLGGDKGYKLGEVKVKLYPRRHGKSKFGTSRILVGFFDLLAVKLQLTFLKKPMLYFGTVGSVLTFLGVAVGLLAFYFRFFLNEGYRPLLYLVIILVLGGLSLFVLGFLAEAITSLREDLERLAKK